MSFCIVPNIRKVEKNKKLQEIWEPCIRKEVDNTINAGKLKFISEDEQRSEGFTRLPYVLPLVIKWSS